MSNLHQLERSLANWFDPRRARTKASSQRQRLKSRQAEIEAAADAAYAAGDKTKGRRLDDAAHRCWSAWQHVR